MIKTNIEDRTYEAPEEAARAILEDVCKRLSGIEFVIVGGWVPVLRADHTTLTHPGTRDVDVLFHKDVSSIANAVNVLLDGSYLISAKHRFQLLKPLNVSGKQLVFNVDLMHPLELGETNDMFQDVMDIGIPDNSEASGRMKMKSICFSASEIIFEESLWSSHSGGGVLSVPLMTAPGLVISKCRSCQLLKRERDAFDIYFVLTNRDAEKTAAQVRELSRSHIEVEGQTQSLMNYLRDTENARTFDRNVGSYSHNTSPSEPPSALVLRTLGGLE